MALVLGDIVEAFNFEKEELIIVNKSDEVFYITLQKSSNRLGFVDSQKLIETPDSFLNR